MSSDLMEGQSKWYMQGFVNGINEARAQIVEIRKNRDPYAEVNNFGLDLLDDKLAKIVAKASL